MMALDILVKNVALSGNEDLRDAGTGKPNRKLQPKSRSTFSRTS
jgi:hypothetical protein